MMTRESFFLIRFRKNSQAVMSETTSPSTQLLETLDLFSLSEIRDVYRSRFFTAFLCPTDLFVQIRVISQLRAQVVMGAPARLVLSTAADIFASIVSFSPANWTSSEPDNWAFPNYPETFTLLSEIFKAAVYLYAIVSLPEYASSSCPLDTDLGLSSKGSASYESLKASHRNALVQMLRSTKNPSHRLYDKRCLYWPMIVAGVAVADGDKADQEDIGARLHEEGVHPGSSAAPLVVEEKLRALWASGKTGWDDCFDEPLIGLTA